MNNINQFNLGATLSKEPKSFTYKNTITNESKTGYVFNLYFKGNKEKLIKPKYISVFYFKELTEKQLKALVKGQSVFLSGYVSTQETTLAGHITTQLMLIAHSLIINYSYVDVNESCESCKIKPDEVK